MAFFCLISIRFTFSGKGTGAGNRLRGALYPRQVAMVFRDFHAHRRRRRRQQGPVFLSKAVFLPLWPGYTFPLYRLQLNRRLLIMHYRLLPPFRQFKRYRWSGRLRGVRLAASSEPLTGGMGGKGGSGGGGGSLPYLFSCRFLFLSRLPWESLPRAGDPCRAQLQWL